VRNSGLTTVAGGPGSMLVFVIVWGGGREDSSTNHMNLDF
jgi:hypothetical protein